MKVETSGAIAKIAQAITQFRKFETRMLVQDGEVLREIFIDCSKNGQQIEVRLKEAPGYMQGRNEYVPSIAVAFSTARSFIGNMTPIIKSCTCTGGDNQLSATIRVIWCELFDTDPSTVEQMSEDDIGVYRRASVRAMLESLLDRGGDAVKLWNSRPIGEKIDSKIDFTKRDLSSKDLTGINLERLDFSGSNFDNCRLISASIGNSEYAKSTFRKCDLEKANLSSLNATRADFSDACMKSVFCYQGNFKNALFKDADLSDSKFNEGDIRGADFTGSTTTGANFQGTKYDEKTKLPPDFPIDNLSWKGTGVDPRRETQLKSALSKGVNDYAGFIEQIEKNFDFERIDKAINMLKKERFQLFSQVTPDQVIGVVRSQREQELVYSCLLTEEGNFTCCTQNLKPCGGLRGALCKHLLVLIIGLTKSEALEPNLAATWVLSSKFHQPKIDKEMMSSVFLQYKGALVGEFDWRPTETIPEDYYT